MLLVNPKRGWHWANWITLDRAVGLAVTPSVDWARLTGTARLALPDPDVGDFGAVTGSDLIDEVYGCELCPGERFGFTRRPNGNGFYKLPPTIGARGEATLLFIGINPRMTTNMRLHKKLAEHRASFAILAENHVPYNGKAGGPRYISPRGEEKH